ncbi:hypothetical protein [Pseudomonas sp. Irchel s3f7]|uniref:hypothetical protein n=1 Tax=Pseudomonas sp. Irchel s3f7 TaxID=2009153 RepID=UPI003530EC47
MSLVHNRAGLPDPVRRSAGAGVRPGAGHSDAAARGEGVAMTDMTLAGESMTLW